MRDKAMEYTDHFNEQELDRAQYLADLFAKHRMRDLAERFKVRVREIKGAR
jgi:hypothetical protein